MSDDDKTEREQIADQVRQYGGYIAKGAALLNPLVGSILEGAIELGAHLVEHLGTGGAIARLQELNDDPVKLITQADLDAQTQSVVDELT